jgi:hypothetical protein
MWKEEIAMLLEEAERILRMASLSSTIRAAGNLSPPPGPVAEPERWARDGVFMQALLDPHIRRVYGAEVSACKVVEGPKRGRGARIRYNLRGRRHDEKWAISLQGIPWREHGGKAFLQGLETLRAALEGSPQAPLLPVSVAYLRPLSLLVWEAPQGASFASLIGTAEGPRAATEVGRALAVLHNTSIGLDSRRPVEKELEALRLKVERLEEGNSGLLHRALPLLEEVEKRIRAVPAKVTPTLRILHPHHILLGERVAFAKVEDLRLSHPLLDVADLLARLTLLGINRGSVQGIAEAADRFRSAYALLGATPEGSMVGFESGALLRLACTQARSEPAGRIAGRLIDQASARLET